MGLNQTYKPLHHKGNQKQSKKTIYGLEENICKRCNQQTLYFQIHKQLIQLNKNKTKQKKHSKNEQKA